MSGKTTIGLQTKTYTKLTLSKSQWQIDVMSTAPSHGKLTWDMYFEYLLSCEDDIAVLERVEG